MLHNNITLCWPILLIVQQVIVNGEDLVLCDECHLCHCRVIARYPMKNHVACFWIENDGK